MDHFTRIEDFSNGLLKDNQRKQFLQDLDTDSVLAKEFHLSESIDAAISDQKSRAFESALLHAQRTYERKRSYTLIYKAAAAFAVLAIIGGSVLFDINTPSSGMDKLVAQYYEVYQPLNGMRGVDPVQNLAVKKAFETYSKGDYQSAIIQFESIVKANPANMQARFYQACACIETGSDKKAIVLLNSIIATQDNFYTPLADYYLGMCYLKTGEKELAIRQFDKISSRQGGYQAKASKILKDLKRL